MLYAMSTVTRVEREVFVLQRQLVFFLLGLSGLLARETQPPLAFLPRALLPASPSSR